MSWLSHLRVVAMMAAIGIAASSAGAQESPAPREAKAQLSPIDQLIQQCAKKSQTAATIEDYSEIIELAEQGLNDDPKPDQAAYFRNLQAWAHNKRGEKYSEAGDEKKALAEFESAVALDSTNWRAVHNRGVSKGSMGDHKAALADFDKTVQLNPNYANAWYNRAELKYEQGDFQGAISDYNRAIQLNPRDGGYYNSRGHALYRMGRSREALSDYSQAVRLNPQDAGALVNRGDVYRQQGIFGPAASDYREAIRIDPKLGRAYMSAAWMMATCPDQRYRNVEQGLASAQKAIELDGEDNYLYLDTLAAALANAGKFEEAKEAAEKAIKAAPESEAQRIRDRLELYGKNQAYRDGGPAESVRAARN